MPRLAKGPHLKLRKQAGAKPIYYIIDNDRRISTGCTAKQTAKANEILETHKHARYVPKPGEDSTPRKRSTTINATLRRSHGARKHRPLSGQTPRILSGDGVQRHHTSRDPLLSEMAHTRWQSVHQRTTTNSPTVSPETVRRELATLKAAFGHAWKNASSSIRLR